MQELKDAGAIKPRIKWKDVYPKFESDERYLNLLGNPGSNPLELFWDVVDGLDQNLDSNIALVEEAFKRATKAEGEGTEFVVKHDTTMSDFLHLVPLAQ